MDRRTYGLRLSHTLTKPTSHIKLEPMSSFSVSFSRLGAAHVLSLAGDLDAHTAPEFEAALEASLAAGDARIVADGAGLSYVSSAGLGVFMAFLEPARARGGDLVIAALPERVFETFDLLGFPEVFRFTPTVAEAAALFDAPGHAEGAS